LSEEDLRVISNYINETGSTFAVVDDTPISEVQKTTKAKTSYEPMPDGDAELVTVVSKRVKVHDGGGSAIESKTYKARGPRKSSNRSSSCTS